MLLLFFFIQCHTSLKWIIEGYQNNSKTVLAYTLNNKSNKDLENGEILDERDLLIDIFSLNDLETDTVRLNASTIKQLFEDTDYKLQDVREKKLVKPVGVDFIACWN